MGTPPFASYPPINVQGAIIPEEWQAYLDDWLLLARGALLLSRKDFVHDTKHDRSLLNFLTTYIREIAAGDHSRVNTPKERSLRHQCFLLIHRIFTEVNPIPSIILERTFLGDMSIVYLGSTGLSSMIELTWKRLNLDENIKMQESKRSLTKILDGVEPLSPTQYELSLRRIGALLKAATCFGHFLMAGSDFIDTLSGTWSSGSTEVRVKITAITYLALSSLLYGEKPNVSLLLDHLYSMKASSEQQNSITSRSSILSQIANTTPFVQKLHDHTTGTDAVRAKSLIEYLEGLRNTSHKLKRPLHHKNVKGKGKSLNETGYGAMPTIHVHKMSLITQIRDLFPDLGPGFVVKLLDEYSDDAELVTAHLLDDTLPPHLKSADQSEQFGSHVSPSPPTDLAPRTTPPLIPQRNNIFDDDDFDNLAVDSSKIHMGRKNSDVTASALLPDRIAAPSKAAILSALAVFDADDDERDDTYDVQDVGGSIHSAMPGSSDDIMGSSDMGRDKLEETLFNVYKISPEVFQRDANTRRGKPRGLLRSETGMTDETIEGWAVMLAREPGKMRRLEAKYSVFGYGQQALKATRWGKEVDDEDGEENDGDEEEGGVVVADGVRREGDVNIRGRGRGRGRGGDAGLVRAAGDGAGPADEQTTKMARMRKDTNKASRANHNRREGRARKIARAGFNG